MEYCAAVRWSPCNTGRCERLRPAAPKRWAVTCSSVMRAARNATPSAPAQSALPEVLDLGVAASTENPPPCAHAPFARVQRGPADVRTPVPTKPGCDGNPSTLPSGCACTRPQRGAPRDRRRFLRAASTARTKAPTLSDEEALPAGAAFLHRIAASFSSIPPTGLRRSTSDAFEAEHAGFLCQLRIQTTSSGPSPVRAAIAF